MPETTSIEATTEAVESIESTENTESTESTESTEQKTETTEKAQPFVSKSQAVADQMEDTAFGSPENTGEKTETTETKEAASTETAKPESKDEVTANAQERIDQLTARASKAEERATVAETENKELKGKIGDVISRIDSLEKGDKPKADAKAETAKTTEVKVYSDEELTKAMQKFMDDSDAAGVIDVLNYKSKQVEQNIVKMYQDEQTRVKTEAAKVQEAHKQEWQSIVKVLFCLQDETRVS